MIRRVNTFSRLLLRLLAGIGLVGLFVLPSWTLGQAETKHRKTAPAAQGKQRQGLEHKSDRDKRFQDIEAKLKALLKEVQTLQSGKAARVMDNGGKTGSLLFTKNLAPNPLGKVVDEIALTRTTYKLSAEKAEALGKFLRQYVKGRVMEVKVDGENLTVTTTPQVQQGIRQFISLTGKKDLPIPWSPLPIHH